MANSESHENESFNHPKGAQVMMMLTKSGVCVSSRCTACGHVSYTEAYTLETHSQEVEKELNKVRKQET